MLDLIVLPKQGNAGGRIFPHTGHLGVSPVIVAGTVATRLPAITAPLPTRSVTVSVKCFETRFSGTFAQEVDKVLYEKSKVIWEPSEGEYGDLGDWQGSFRISVPPEVVNRTHSAQWMKEWKTSWRLEIAVDHRPIPHVGHRIVRFFTLNLYNHRAPSILPPTPPIPVDIPGAEVTVDAPHGAFGPGDSFVTSLFVRVDNPSTCVRKVSATLERRLDSLDPDTPPKRQSPDPHAVSPNPSRLSSLLRRSVSPRPPTLANILEAPPTPQSMSSTSSSHSLVTKISETTSEDIAPDATGSYRCAVPIHLPRRTGRWDIGETLTSSLVTISFDLRIKVALKTRKGTKEFSLPAMPIQICGTSAAERSEAASTVPTKPVKRKHRSSRRGLYMQEGTVDIADPIVSQTMRRLRTRSQTASPIVTQSTFPTNIKSILLAPDHSAQPQSISFVFPSPNLESPDIKDDYDTSPGTLPTILQPLPYLLTPPSSRLSMEPIDYESMSILKQYQQTGRRISTTASEEEEMQPSRVRQRTLDHGHPTLPSLSALGLGLPQLPDDGRPERRPRTAPVHSAFSHIPPPLSGRLSESQATPTARPVTSAGPSMVMPPPVFAFDVGR